MWVNHYTIYFLSSLLILAHGSCASSSGSKAKNSEKESKTESKKKIIKSKSTDSASSIEASPDSEAPKAQPAARVKKEITTGKLVRVTMAYGGEAGLDGVVPQQILGDVLQSVDSISRKELDNIPLAVTHMGLLRLSGQADDMALFQKRSSSGGSQDPWFLMESGYGAVRRKNFAFAEYLFSKAEKLARDPYIKAAAANGFGLRYWADGNMPLAAKEVQRAVSLSDSYAPAIVSLSILCLRAGDYVGAEQHFRKASSLLPQSATARIGLAAALRLQGKASEAAEILRSLSKSKPNDKRIVWNLALTLSDEPSKKGEALQLLKQYFSMAGVYPDLDGRANALQNRLNLPPPPPPRPPAGTAPPVPNSAVPEGSAASDHK